MPLLEELAVLEAPTAAAMRRAIGLRNVVAHGYAGIDVDMVYVGATAGLADLDDFARQVSSWVASRGDST